MTPTRRLLVVNAACRETPHFLPAAEYAARSLWRVLLDPERGCCEPLQTEGCAQPGFLDDPDVAAAANALKAALDQCAVNEEVLVLAWIGHGDYVDRRFYTLPRGTDLKTPQWEGIELIAEIEKRWRGHPSLKQPAGLILILDTCYSGGASNHAAEQLVSTFGNTLAFELFSATSLRGAYDCQFARTLASQLIDGEPESAADYLAVHDLRKRISEELPKQYPVHLGFSGDRSNPQLWLSRNYGRTRVRRASSLVAAAEAAQRQELNERAVRLALLACRVTRRDFVLPEAQSMLCRALAATQLVRQTEPPSDCLHAFVWDDEHWGVFRNGDALELRCLDNDRMIVWDDVANVMTARVAVGWEGRCVVIASTARETFLCSWSRLTGKRIGKVHAVSFGVRVIAAAATAKGTAALLVEYSRFSVLLNPQGRFSRPRKPDGSHHLHLEEVRYGAVSADGRHAVTVDWHGAMRCWDLASGAQLGEVMQHQSGVNSVRFDQSGSRVVTASAFGSVIIWDIPSGARRREFDLRAANVFDRSALPGLSFGMPMTDAAFSADAERIVSIVNGRAALVWEMQSYTPGLRPVRDEEGFVTATFTGRGDGLHTISKAKRVKHWSLPELAPMPPKDLLYATFHPDGERFLTHSLDNVTIWDVRTLEPTRTLPYADLMTCARFSTDGAWLVIAAGSCIERWNAQTFEPVGSSIPTPELVVELAISPSRHRIAFVATKARALHLWRGEDGSVLDLKESLVNTITFSPDGTRLVSGNSFGQVRIWDAATGIPIGKAINHDTDASTLEKAIIASSISKDGRWVLSASQSGVAHLSDIATGSTLATIRHGLAIHSARFSPDGKQVLTASSDGTARRWHALTGAPIGEPMSHPESIVTDAQFGPDGDRVITACGKGFLRIWDLEGRAEIETSPPGPKAYVKNLCQGPDGRFLFISEGRAWLWSGLWLKPISFDGLVEQARARIQASALTITAADALVAPLITSDVIGQRADTLVF